MVFKLLIIKEFRCSRSHKLPEMRSRQKVKIVGKIMVHAVILTIAIVIMILALAVAAGATTEVIDLTIQIGVVENAVAIEATTTEGTTRKISESNSNRTGISKMVISMRTTERARHLTRCIRSVRATTVATEIITIPITETIVEDLEASIAEDAASSEVEAIVMATQASEVAMVDTLPDPKTETGKKQR